MEVEINEVMVGIVANATVLRKYLENSASLQAIR